MAIKLIAPVVGPITQLFGEDPESYKKWGYAGHNGIDYGVPNGTPVGAAVSGTVAAVSFENGGYGNYVKLIHTDAGKPYYTYYAHLASATVSPGQRVKAGTIVGLSNNTGASTGPHLHFGVKIEGQNPAFKGYVDPFPFFTAGIEVDTTDTIPTDQFTDAVALPNLSFEVLSEFLNVRNGPGVEYSIVMQLQQGAKIKARRMQSKSVWIEYEPGKWCAVAFNGIVNLKVK